MHEIKRKYLNTYVSPEIPTFILPIVVSGFLDPKNRITFRVSFFCFDAFCSFF
jgi:hypothetical protein